MNYLNEMIRRNTRDMLRRNWGKAVALTVTVMAVLLLGSMLESAIGGERCSPSTAAVFPP